VGSLTSSTVYTLPLAFAETFLTPPLVVLEDDTVLGVPISREDLRRGEPFAELTLFAITRPMPTFPYEDEDLRLVGVEEVNSSSGIFSPFSDILKEREPVRLAILGGLETVRRGDGAFLG
jgi:hypothetical protein